MFRNIIPVSHRINLTTLGCLPKCNNTDNEFCILWLTVSILFYPYEPQRYWAINMSLCEKTHDSWQTEAFVLLRSGPCVHDQLSRYWLVNTVGVLWVQMASLLTYVEHVCLARVSGKAWEMSYFGMWDTDWLSRLERLSNGRVFCKNLGRIPRKEWM